MPELPEVEVTRRSFAAAISGARIASVWVGKPLRWPLGCAPESLVGRQVLGVRRRGKYLLLDLDQGMLLMHLGMSGSLVFASTLAQRGMHDHFELQTSQGSLRLHDPRRFGAVVYAEHEQDEPAHKLLGHWGMEPLDDAFTLAAFTAGLKASRAPIKQVLLAGRLVVGVGNIYASEALFLSGIRPTTVAQSLGPKRVQRLHTAIVQVLSLAVEKGGSTLRNFSSADGSAGHFQTGAHVYAREGLPCHTCASLVQMVRQGQRSSFFCPSCQQE
ncbi:bifunctional DNA-formamidopyrimidine glycosylase/DNA-(apurinic or apyrimidinic site) lyase [Simplicispira psychrophila]|uniref:bifunctional DNA-formamidopyrimidine glycosylase/DNA-(apurinic or apyrimidinic site) lyase n=1 Tax=Simplicispira psychrophila TaxID=80882 RepID=UPI00048766E5|nr:bifunctional DNA-formamidopyrimidine glycosylase/DNA-(apurinic or apyrimidinic site) lyase [Simplicispira psychrophila]